MDELAGEILPFFFQMKGLWVGIPTTAWVAQFDSAVLHRLFNLLSLGDPEVVIRQCKSVRKYPPRAGEQKMSEIESVRKRQNRKASKTVSVDKSEPESVRY